MRYSKRVPPVGSSNEIKVQSSDSFPVWFASVTDDTDMNCELCQQLFLTQEH